LATARAYVDLADKLFALIEHRCAVRSLVRVDSDHEHH
jgi:hypothetical protein